MQVRKDFIDAAAGRTWCHQYLQPSTPKGTTIPTRQALPASTSGPAHPAQPRTRHAQGKVAGKLRAKAPLEWQPEGILFVGGCTLQRVLVANKHTVMHSSLTKLRGMQYAEWTPCMC